MERDKYQIIELPGYSVNYSKDNLIQLLRNGYGFFKDNERNISIAQAQYEYGNADKVYFALNKNGSEIGSLSIGLRLNKEDDPFWIALSTQREVYDKNFLACYIYGIVVHPEFRREGIASALLSKMIEDLNPQIIFGQTNVQKLFFLELK